jgi:hypothetical protein
MVGSGLRASRLGLGLRRRFILGDQRRIVVR